MTAFDPGWEALLQPGLATRLFDLSQTPPLVPDAPFNLATAWWAACLCHASYLPDYSEGKTPPPAGWRRDVLAAHGFEEMEFIDEGAIQGVLVAHGPYGVLAFRGTDDLADWNVNLRIDPAPWPGGGRVHRGFLHAFDAVSARLVDLRSRYAGRRYLLTGHSQGAAMAVLAANMTHPCAVYVFGCPRMGDAAFADALGDEPIYQVIHGRDAVTRIPPPLGDFETTLPGRRFRVGGGIAPDAADSPGSPEGDLASLIERLSSPGQWRLPVRELQDHAIVNYVAAIERAMAQDDGG